MTPHEIIEVVRNLRRLASATIDATVMPASGDVGFFISSYFFLAAVASVPKITVTSIL